MGISRITGIKFLGLFKYFKRGELYCLIGRSCDGKWLKVKVEVLLYNIKDKKSKELLNSLPFIKFHFGFHNLPATI